MPAVATQSSAVTCGHSGTVRTTGSAKLTVDGSPVLVASGIVGMAVAGCKTPTVVTTPQSKPCTTVTSVTNPPSLSQKLFVDGNPVVLATLKGATDGVVAGNPQLQLAATVTQTHLSAT